MQSFIVFALFVAAASASVGLGGIGVSPIGLGSAQVLTNVRTIQPVATNVVTPVVTPVVRNVVSRVVRPVVANTPVLRTVPVQTHLVSSYGGLGGLHGLGGLGGYGLSSYGALSGYGLGGSIIKK